MNIGPVTLVTIIFVVLKLVNAIDWSWWWVLSPIWISVIVIGLVTIVFAVISAFGEPK